MTMTRQDFEELASVLRELPDPVNRAMLATEVARFCAAKNVTARQRFIEACQPED